MSRPLLGAGSAGAGKTGIFVYALPELALRAPFPTQSKLLHAPRALLRVRVGGMALFTANQLDACSVLDCQLTLYDGNINF